MGGFGTLDLLNDSQTTKMRRGTNTKDITKDTNSDMPTKSKKNLSKILKILVGYQKLVGN